jgi:Na+-transporting methylmalonyl-CoA/oxaloacetate decarboxylase gamma subunit
MEEYLKLLVEKLDPSSILLILVLYGVWRIAERAMDKFSQHADKVSESLGQIAEDCHELRKDIAVVVARVDSHESRIEKLEDKK